MIWVQNGLQRLSTDDKFAAGMKSYNLSIRCIDSRHIHVEVNDATFAFSRNDTARHRENLMLLFDNNKGDDKFVQPRILTSTFVVLSFDSRTTIYKLVTIAEQAG